jgi:hypothetical protein
LLNLDETIFFPFFCVCRKKWIFLHTFAKKIGKMLPLGKIGMRGWKGNNLAYATLDPGQLVPYRFSFSPLDDGAISLRFKDRERD